MKESIAILTHGIGSREDLPLPLGWAIVGAAAAVVVSFVALGALWHEPRLGDSRGDRPVPALAQRILDGRGFRGTLAAAGLLITGWTLLALAFGKDDARNPVPWVVYVWLWVGLVPVSVVFGPVWRQLNPIRAAHSGLNRALQLDPCEGMRALPSTVGWWPAAGGLLAFTWLELVYPDSTTLPVLRITLALYTAVQLLAALIYGSTWFDRGDAFEAWSGLFGRISPLGRSLDGRIVLRRPLAGLDAMAPAPGIVATVMVMLGSTAYDGLSGSTAWVQFAQAQAWPRLAVGTLGLLASILFVGGLYCVCTAGAGLVAGSGWRGMPTAFAHSVVPVALGYVVAHYYSFFVLEGQRALARLSDPLGIGADWLGTGSLQPDATLVTPTIVADVQLAAIVLGHVLGVVLAHDRAVRLFPRRAAIVGQLPLLVLMVALTCYGLFLLFWS